MPPVGILEITIYRAGLTSDSPIHTPGACLRRVPKRGQRESRCDNAAQPAALELLPDGGGSEPQYHDTPNQRTQNVTPAG